MSWLSSASLEAGCAAMLRGNAGVTVSRATRPRDALASSSIAQQHRSAAPLSSTAQQHRSATAPSSSNSAQ